MSDNKQNYRRAKPIYMGLRRKRNGQIQNLVGDNDRKFAKQAEKAFVPFVQQRYNMYHDFAEGNVNITQLLGNHVYGDYRLKKVGNDAAYQFVHKQYPYMGGPMGIFRAPLAPDRMLKEGLSNSEGSIGLMGPTNNAGQYVPTQAQLFDNIVNSRDPASIFFLPSLGTAIMSFASLTPEWPTAIQQYFAGHQSDEKKRGRIPELFFKLLVNTDSDDDKKLALGDSDLGRAPWFENVEVAIDNPVFARVASTAYDVSTPVLVPGDIGNNEVNLFFMSWAHSILEHSDFNDVRQSVLDDAQTRLGRPLTPNEVLDNDVAVQLCRNAIQATFNSSNDLLTVSQVNAFGFGGGGANIPNRDRFESNGINFRGATLEFLQIMKLETFDTGGDTLRGTRVTLRDDILDADGKFPNYVSGDPPVEEWQEHSTYFPEAGEYAWELDGEWIITDGSNPNRVTVQQVGYPLTTDDEDDVDGIDTSVEQVYELRGLRSNDYNEVEDEDQDEEEEEIEFSANFNGNLYVLSRIMLDAYFEMESHLSLVLNSTKVAFNKYSKDLNQTNSDIVTDDDFYETRGKNKTAVADFLAQERSTIMGGLAGSFLALAGDSNYRQLFEGDLNLREVKWYSDFIATRLLQARPIEEQQSALAELRAEPVPGSVAAFQLVTPQTVLRKLDVPTLRLIMSRYFVDFYQRLTAIARRLDERPQSKNQRKKNKKRLSEQMWDTVEATVSTMLSLEGVNPAEFWRQTFAAVENARGNDRSRLILPPSWAGTVFRADLERDAFITGKAPDLTKNISLFRTYVSFLRTTYSEEYELIGNLLGAFQTTAAKQLENIQELRDFFATRLENDNKFRLRGEGVPAYRLFVYICRGVLSIPDYALAAEMAIASPPPAFAAPDTSELEGGIMVGAEPTEFVSPSTPTLGPTGFPVLPNPSMLRPDRRA